MTEEGKPATAEQSADCEILVVEDDPVVRRIIALTLRSIGYAVSDVEDGPSAIEIMNRAEQIDLLLTDILLPNGIGGNEVAMEYRKRFRGGKIIYSTGSVQSVDDGGIKMPAGTRLLSKPYSPETLVETIDELLDGPQPRAIENA